MIKPQPARRIKLSGFAFAARCSIALVAVLGATHFARAEAAKQREQPGPQVKEFFQQYCVDCHAADHAEGELDLQQLKWDFARRETRDRWLRIYDRIAKREMPPDAEVLDDVPRRELLDALARAMHRADYADVVKNGRSPLRRLNRREYEDNLRDRLQLPHLDVRDILPEDREAHQTVKAAEALDVTRVQLNAYLDAAEKALRAAIAPAVEARQPVQYRALATNMFPKAVDHAGRESSFFAKNGRIVPLTGGDLARIRKENAHDPEMEVAIFRSADWPYYGYPENFVAEIEGPYQVRFYARAVRQVRDFRLLPAFNPVPMTFRARQPSLADVSGDVRATGGIIDVAPEGQVYQTTVWLQAGQTIEYSLLGLPVPFPITSHGGPHYYDFPPMPRDGHRGIAYRWIEIEGPVVAENWPPASHRVLFDELPIRDAPADSELPIEVHSEDPQVDIARLMRRFADRVAHVPVEEHVLQPYEQLVHDQLAAGRSFAESMSAGYQAFLCSTHFLFLPALDGAGEHQQHAIASRLSHLLWNSGPDAPLRELADSGRLGEPTVLQQECDRMIADAKFDRMIENFTDHWLDLKNLRRDDPDIRLYPEYRGDDYLVDSMEWETRAFVKRIVQQNLPIATLVDSDFALVNDRLARHYDLDPVPGSKVRAVTLPSWSRRGGLLTQGAVLKVTANGTATSPVIRGAWVMDRILGQPPPPPPPDVPAVEPDIRGATTIREILAAHTADTTCAQCHAQFDPVGFALENFDILGGWRDRYRSLEKGDEITGIDRAGHAFSYRVADAVESTGQLPDGRSFESIDELKTLLRRDERQIARNFLQRLCVYGTGVPMRFSDRKVIESILDTCAPTEYRAGDLLRELVQSRIFLEIEP